MTVTVDPEVIAAGNAAVAAGLADSLSGWVNAALAARASRDRHLQALAAAVADHETRAGEITAAEIAAQQRSDRESAVVVRGKQRRVATKTGAAKTGAAKSGAAKSGAARRGKGAA